MERVTGESKSLVEALQSPNRKERYTALGRLTELDEQGETLSYLKIFAHDESYTIQKQAVDFIEEKFDKNSEGAIASLTEFTQSQFFDLRMKAFKILFSRGIINETLVARFRKLGQEKTIWELLSEMNPNWLIEIGRYEEISPTMLELLVENFGNDIQGDLRGKRFAEVKLSPTAIAILAKLNQTAIISDYLVEVKEDGPKTVEMFNHLAAINDGISIMQEHLAENHQDLDWDVQFQSIMAITLWHRVSEYQAFVRSVASRIPFKYFHDTFSNSVVDRGGRKTSIFVEFLTELTDDRRAIIMRDVFDEAEWGDSLSDTRARYLSHPDVEDGSSSPVQQNTGGIDFNPNYLNIQSQGNKVKLPVLNNPQQFRNIEINGLVPFIFNITPITNIPMILGESEEQSEEFNLTQLN